MNIEEAITLVENKVFAATSEHLESLQINLLRGAWENKTYEQIAETYCFSVAHTKAVGAKLWIFLSQIFNTKVHKRNFRLVVEKNLVIEKQFSTHKNTINPAFLRPELPGGQLSVHSPFYIERPPIEKRCHQAIQQPGALIRIYAPKQMGKTSLMTRILNQARQRGYHTTALSLELACQEVLSNLETFLKWFCGSISKSIGLPHHLQDYWDQILGSNYSCTDYVENYLLSQLQEPLVIAVDEMDIIFQYPEIATDFCHLLKACHEKSKQNQKYSNLWSKLRLVIIYSTENYLPLEFKTSLFNLGLSVELSEFNVQQVLHFAQVYGLNWQKNQAEKLMSLVGGYPYLIHQALHHIWQGDITLEQLEQQNTVQEVIYREHLHCKLFMLRKYPELLKAFIQVTSTKKAVELEKLPALQLHSLGLVRLRGNQVMPSCNLYRYYF